MKKTRLKTRQQGFTLIEIMIALVLGAFLIGGVLQIFLNSKQTYRMQDNLSRMQENGRFAMEFISRDVRMADYRSCYTDSSNANAISGTNGSTTPTPDAPDTITVIQKLAVVQANLCGASLQDTRTYKIQNNASGQPSLYRNINGGGFQELIEGIENMQIIYGVDTNADKAPDYYVDAATVPNWSQVISIRISLLAVSLADNLTSQPVPYTYNGTTTTPTDRKLRRVFTSTIVLRNRL